MFFFRTPFFNERLAVRESWEADSPTVGTLQRGDVVSGPHDGLGWPVFDWILFGWLYFGGEFSINYLA